MRILYCIPTLEHGGAERQLSYLSAELTRHGHDVHVAFTRPGANYDRIEAAGATMHNIGGSGNHDPRILFALIQLLVRLKPDVVQTTLTQMDILGGIAAVLTRTPCVLREANSAAAYPSTWKNRLRRIVATRAAAVVCNSEEGAAYWRAAGVSRWSVIRNGVPPPVGDARASALSIEAVRTHEKIVLFVGRLDEQKNAGALIHALARIDRDLDIRAVICGDGPQRNELERLAATLGVGERVVFTGFVDDVRPLMRRAHVLVSLSRFEGCPNVVLEAMTAGCPLLVSDIAAHRELLDDGTALFVDANDAHAVAEAIATTLRAPAVARERARIAQSKAAGWSIEATARQYEQIYSACVKGAR